VVGVIGLGHTDKTKTSNVTLLYLKLVARFFCRVLLGYRFFKIHLPGEF